LNEGNTVYFTNIGGTGSGINDSQQYYVIYQVTTTTFRISASKGGTVVAHTGTNTATGHHPVVRSDTNNFYTPDLRGYFIRSLTGDGDRKMGGYQLDGVKAHRHAIPQGDGYSASFPSGGGNTSFGTSYSMATTYAGGGETRPKNFSLIYCIKY
jgi:hypothetical protein